MGEDEEKRKEEKEEEGLGEGKKFLGFFVLLHLYKPDGSSIVLGDPLSYL